MAEGTAIEWCDHTFNPWEGCQKVGPGCDNCYAETRNARFGGGTAPNWGPDAPRRRTSAANWRKPLKWNAEAAAFAEKHGRKQRVFCAIAEELGLSPSYIQNVISRFTVAAPMPGLRWAATERQEIARAALTSSTPSRDRDNG